MSNPKKLYPKGYEPIHQVSEKENVRNELLNAILIDDAKEKEERLDTDIFDVMSTAFMTGFNQLYYSFSPTIAYMERENPLFQKAVSIFITPMISTLSIMILTKESSEVEVLGLGISVIALNLRMYIAVPAMIGFSISKRIRSNN